MPVRTQSTDPARIEAARSESSWSTAVAIRNRGDAAVVEIDSTRLLQGQREIHIRHGGGTYRLLHTRNDKLILTK